MRRSVMAALLQNPPHTQIPNTPDATPPADTQDADPILVHIGESHEIICDVPEVLDPKRWVFDKAGLPTAGALKASVEGDDDEARLSKRAPVDITRRLLLAAADR